MSKHTPGPWNVESDTNEQGPMITSGKRYIAVVYNDTDRVNANSRIIAAAPDLLAACSIAFAASCTRSESYRKWTVEDQRVHEILKAAIAKAKQGD